MDIYSPITYMLGSRLSPHTYLSMIQIVMTWTMIIMGNGTLTWPTILKRVEHKKLQNPGFLLLSRLVSRWYRMHLPVYILIVYQKRLSQKLDIPYRKSNWIYTTFTNFSMKYHLMCKVFTDVGGIKQLYHVCPLVPTLAWNITWCARSSLM